MAKILPATCSTGVVTADGVPVPSAVILSEGIGASQGILVLDEDDAKYIPKTSPDLKETLEKLVSALGSLTTALTAIDLKSQATSCPAGSGATIPLPLAAASIASISSVQSELIVLKETLK